MTKAIILFIVLISSSCTHLNKNTHKLMIEKKITLKASKGAVWSALTTEKELSLWWNKGVKLEDYNGGAFYEPWGDNQLATGHVLLVKPKSRIRFTWKEKSWSRGEESICEFKLNEYDGVTTLKVLHFGWDKFSNSKEMVQGFSVGWDTILNRLKKYFDNIKNFERLTETKKAELTSINEQISTLRMLIQAAKERRQNYSMKNQLDLDQLVMSSIAEIKQYESQISILESRKRQVLANFSNP